MKNIDSQLYHGNFLRHKTGSSRRWKLLAAFFLISLALMAAAFLNGGTLPLIQPLILESLAPFQKVVNGGTGAVGRVWSDYINLVDLGKDNQKLSIRVLDLEAEVNRLKEAEMKLWRLQKLMGFSMEKHIEALPVNVLGREADNWSRMILLDKGKNAGLEKGMAVITSEGLVGRVHQTTGGKSKALLITDWRSSVDAMVQRSRARGVVVGKSSQLIEMKYIPLNADVRIGDTVVSSGLGGVFPKGLLVGRVVKVIQKRNALFQRAVLIPAVDVTEVEEALIIVDYGE